VLTGFLPPEDGTGRGQGHFSYVIRLKDGVPSGTRIRNVALIQFDFGLTIGTHQVDPHDPSKGTDPQREYLNTVDAAPPQSQVLTLPATVPPGGFTVHWFGQDDPGGSGIASYEIYVSDNATAWTLWKGQASDTSAVFPGQLGHTYAFYSVATDNVGQREAAPLAVDAVTTVTEGSAPALEIRILEQGIELSWPAAASGFALEFTPSLDPPVPWQAVGNPPTPSGDRFVLTVPYLEGSQFFRLRKP
jgi:hypothetical protein